MSRELDLESLNVETVLSDRETFNRFVYTPLAEAVKQMEARWSDPSIDVPAKIPPLFGGGFKAVIFRQVITSNYEIRRFISIIDALALEPIFWEYYEDKFTSNNEWKHSLGKLFFYRGKGKKDGAKIDSLKVIDFNTYNGKKLSEVRTLWGQSLIDFHHELFESQFRILPKFFDASEWFYEHGNGAKAYYKPFLALFLKHAILFENFLLDEKEYEFTRDVFLPAFIALWKETGHKPLIVSLEPTDIEGDRFWMCHPHEDREYVEARLSRDRLS